MVFRWPVRSVRSPHHPRRRMRSPETHGHRATITRSRVLLSWLHESWSEFDLAPFEHSRERGPGRRHASSSGTESPHPRWREAHHRGRRIWGAGPSKRPHRALVAEPIPRSRWRLCGDRAWHPATDRSRGQHSLHVPPGPPAPPPASCSQVRTRVSRRPLPLGLGPVSAGHRAKPVRTRLAATAHRVSKPRQSEAHPGPTRANPIPRMQSSSSDSVHDGAATRVSVIRPNE